MAKKTSNETTSSPTRESKKVKVKNTLNQTIPSIVVKGKKETHISFGRKETKEFLPDEISKVMQSQINRGILKKR